MKAWKIPIASAVTVVLIGGGAYGAFSYGQHRGYATGYNTARTVDNKQISSLKTQVQSEKNQVNKEDAAMWSAIGASSKQANQSLNCTSYKYGINDNYTSTSCN